MSENKKILAKLDATLDGIDVDTALSTLNPRHEDVLRRRYGLAPYKQPLTQVQIAEQMDISHQRIGQIESKALGQLATYRELYRPERAMFMTDYDPPLYPEWEEYPSRLWGHRTWEDRPEH